jgi:uncharacterized protein (UPF0335 family)
MTDVGGIAGEVLRSIVERVERLQEEIDALNMDKSEVFKEAKGNGFDIKTLKKLIQRRRVQASDLQEQDALLELYEAAVNGDDSRAHARAA